MHATELKDYPYWVFDLDNTLYPVATDLFGQIDKRMCGFIAEYLNVNHEEAYRVQKQYFREYGTTLRGLMDCHGGFECGTSGYALEPSHASIKGADIRLHQRTPGLR